jgi:hypothetical protein
VTTTTTTTTTTTATNAEMQKTLERPTIFFLFFFYEAKTNSQKMMENPSKTIHWIELKINYFLYLSLGENLNVTNKSLTGDG